MIFQEVVNQIGKLLKSPPVLHTSDAFISGVAWEITAGLVHPALTSAIKDWNSTPAGKALYNTSFGAITGLAAAVAGTVLTCLAADAPKNLQEWKTENWKAIGTVLVSSFAPEFLWQMINWALEELDEAAGFNTAQKYTVASIVFFTICALAFHSLSHITRANWKSWELSGVVGMSSTSFFWFAASTNSISNLFSKSLASGGSAAMGSASMHFLYYLFSMRHRIAAGVTQVFRSPSIDPERQPINDPSKESSSYTSNTLFKTNERTAYDTDPDDHASLIEEDDGHGLEDATTAIFFDFDPEETQTEVEEFFDTVSSLPTETLSVPLVNASPTYVLQVSNPPIIQKASYPFPPPTLSLIPACA
jgi:hypothetical protein